MKGNKIRCLVTVGIMLAGMLLCGAVAAEEDSCENYFCSVMPVKKMDTGAWKPEETFFVGEWVGVRCADFPSSEQVTIYIVKNRGWADGDEITGAVKVRSVSTDASGLYIDEVWVPNSGDEGFYDIVVDMDQNGVYNSDIDRVLSRSSKVMALEVVPEPATLVLLGAGALSMAGLVLVRKRA